MKINLWQKPAYIVSAYFKSTRMLHCGKLWTKCVQTNDCVRARAVDTRKLLEIICLNPNEMFVHLQKFCANAANHAVLHMEMNLAWVNEWVCVYERV